jgi:hypothetical protein
MKKFISIPLALLATLASTAALAQANIPVIAPPTAARAPGLYVAVLDGAIKVSNTAGNTSFTAGQFGYTASPMIAPVPLPKNPGLSFALPAAFSPSASPTGPTSGARPAAVDCIVR